MNTREPPPVGVGFRVGTGLLDLVFFGSLCGIVWGALFAGSRADPAPVQLLTALPLLGIPLSWWLFGATPGQWLMSSQVVTTDGERPGLLRSCARLVLTLLLLLPLGLGLWVGAWRQDKRGWYDRLTGTRVVGDRSFAPPGKVRF